CIMAVGLLSAKSNKNIKAGSFFWCDSETKESLLLFPKHNFRSQGNEIKIYLVPVHIDIIGRGLKRAIPLSEGLFSFPG
ncbi:MAG TPA: hypothetical protein VK994_03710, partial [Bacteroidales bacterium]|nr:hypothetical protein [Bacteroidales bacterium]